LAFAAGANTSDPAAMSAAETSCPLVSATPASVNDPAPESAPILTSSSALAGASAASANPKSPALNT
jgi:hypothetical protein